MSQVIHMVADGYQTWKFICKSACGVDMSGDYIKGHPFPVTDDPAKVTCKRARCQNRAKEVSHEQDKREAKRQ